MKVTMRRRVLFAVAGLMIVSTISVVSGCSHTEKTSTEVPFKKTAPPAAYSDWQKKMASGTLPR